MEKRKFLVLGHPRSGTGFMVKLLRQYGYQVGHEVMGKDGISSWMFVVDDYQVYTDPTLNKKDFNFDYLIMNLRHPLDIISSSYYTENPSKISMDYRRKHLNLENLNRVETAVKSVLDWYKLIELQRPILKVCIDKNPEEKLFYFLKRFENSELTSPVKIEGKVNARNHAMLEFAYIKEHCNKEILLELENFCNLYDYEMK